LEPLRTGYFLSVEKEERKAKELLENPQPKKASASDSV